MIRKRVIVAITGASGPIYGIRILEILRDLPEVETHLICSLAGRRTIQLETDLTMSEVEALADVTYHPNDFAASISSGSFVTAGMIIAPCSVSTLSCIAASITKDLVVRAADVVLKERRRLVLLLRESPLHLGHLRHMVEVTEMGAIVAPPVPAFYPKPSTVREIVDHSVGRTLQLLGFDLPWMQVWSTPE
jgi:flavin prenyltransferase